MKIGVDIDGVILNYERELKTYAELYNFLELKRTVKTNRDEHYIQKRHDWTDDEKKNFVDKYFVQLSKTVPFMPGAVDMIKRLKEDGHQLLILSARGGLVPEMKDVALERLKEVGLVFDNYYWNLHDKAEIAKQENLDFMIDDCSTHVESLTKSGIRTIYFRDVDMPVFEESELLFDATNWGEVYRIICQNNK